MTGSNKVIQLCFAVLNGDPSVQKQAVALLRSMEYTNNCEDCQQPALTISRWCPSCLAEHVKQEGLPDTLGLL